MIETEHKRMNSWLTKRVRTSAWQDFATVIFFCDYWTVPSLAYEHLTDHTFRPVSERKLGLQKKHTIRSLPTTSMHCALIGYKLKPFFSTPAKITLKVLISILEFSSSRTSALSLSVELQRNSQSTPSPRGSTFPKPDINLSQTQIFTSAQQTA